MKNKKIIFASDYKGIELRSRLIEHGRSLDLEIEDIGVKEGSLLDYVDITKQLVEKLSDQTSIGVLICNDGHGVTMAANKFNVIRAALCRTLEDAKMARCKLNANVLCLESQNSSLDDAVSCFDAYINTPFESEKYEKSVSKLGMYATQHSTSGVNLIVRAIIIHQDHILLSTPTESNKEFAANLYFLPGGHVDYKESAIDALKRELMEEMNLVTSVIAFIGVLECSWNKKENIYHELNLIYKVESAGLSLKFPPESTEPFIKFVWCPISQLSNYKILPQQLIPMLQEATRCQSNALFYSQMYGSPKDEC